MSDKYYRLVTFVVDICPKPLRELLIVKAKADPGVVFTSLDSYLQFRQSDIDNLRRRRKITSVQYALIYPANGPVDVQEWDVTLVAVLLQELFRGQLQQTEVDCIDDIKGIRNSLQHIAHTGLIDDNDFNTSWSVLKHSVNTLIQCAGTSVLPKIEEEIKAALTESMPNLGHVLRMWHSVMYVELQLQNATLVAEIQALKEQSKESNTILTKASVKRKGRSGVPEKRIKIVDIKVERMIETLGKGLREENDSLNTNKEDVEDITSHLKNNHRVIVTGFDKKKIYKCALAAVKEMKYERTDQCLQIDNPSDWKRVAFEDVRVVLFREPFGSIRKVEMMIDEFDNMLDAADENNDDFIDIVIVNDQKRLKEVTGQCEHDMLSTASTVYIDSTADTETGEVCATDETVHGNLLERSKMYKLSYKIKRVDSQMKMKAEKLFMEHSTVAIVGSTGSGKTNLSFQLLPSYDLSNGEENFLVVIDPEELKYVKFSLKPVLILKLLTGIAFDSMEAHKWFRQFDVLYAAVQKKKTAIISVLDSECFQMWQSNMPTHPLLEHVVYTDGGSKNKNQKMINVTAETSKSGTKADQRSDSDDNDKNVTDHCVRYVKSVRTYNIKTDDEDRCIITGSCVLPTGDVLLTDFMNNKLKKLNVNYKHVSECSLPHEPYNVCYIGNNEAVVYLEYYKLQFVNVAESLTLTREIDTDHYCYALACHGNLLYGIDDDSVHVYTTDGTYRKCLYTDPDTDSYWYNCSITVSNDGSRIYITDRDNDCLITINNSGQHEFTLSDVNDQSNLGDVCVDNQGYVYVIGYNYDDQTSIIVQISSDGRQKLGTVFELDDLYNTICFDRDKSAFLVAGKSNKIKLLKLQ